MDAPYKNHPLIPTIQEIRNMLANIRPVWPFFGLLTFAMAVMYGVSVAYATALHQFWPLLAFTLLMVIHTALHWLSPLMGINRIRGLIYEILQIALVVGLVCISGYEMLVFGLFMGLIGEMLGVVRPLRRSLIAIFFLVIGIFVLHGAIFGWSTIAWSLVLTIVFGTLFIVIYVYLFTSQLEEKERAEKLLKELEIAHRQLGEYATRIEELTLANEGQRMARELHDTLSQGLAGVILQLEAAGQHLDEGHNEKATAIVKQAISRARSTLAEARKVIDDLRNVFPVGTDLEDFLQGEAEHFTALTGLPCETSIDARVEVPDPLAVQIEKIISEGLTNIVNHAQARRSWVHLNSEAGQITLEIGDDGKGFTVGAGQFESGHYGLVGIRERARLAGGTLKVDSQPGKGTILRVTFPATTSEGKN